MVYILLKRFRPVAYGGALKQNQTMILGLIVVMGAKLRGFRPFVSVLAAGLPFRALLRASV